MLDRLRRYRGGEHDHLRRLSRLQQHLIDGARRAGISLEEPQDPETEESEELEQVEME